MNNVGAAEPPDGKADGDLLIAAAVRQGAFQLRTGAGCFFHACLGHAQAVHGRIGFHRQDAVGVAFRHGSDFLGRLFRYAGPGIIGYQQSASHLGLPVFKARSEGTVIGSVAAAVCRIITFALRPVATFRVTFPVSALTACSTVFIAVPVVLPELTGWFAAGLAGSSLTRFATLAAIGFAFILLIYIFPAGSSILFRRGLSCRRVGILFIKAFSFSHIVTLFPLILKGRFSPSCAYLCLSDCFTLSSPVLKRLHSPVLLRKCLLCW